jgi:hypothetical protein
LIGGSALIIKKHVYIFDSIIEGLATPFDFIEEKLILQTPGDLESCTTIVGTKVERNGKLPLDRGLNSRL